LAVASFSLSGLFRSLLRWGGRLALIIYFAAGLLILVGRYWLMPEIARFRPMIEQAFSQAIGLPVEIGELSADWRGLHPRFSMRRLVIRDRASKEALALERVEAEIGWTTLLFLKPRLHRLEIFAPFLEVRRDAAGRVFVAGLPVKSEGESAFADWLLDQYRVIVRDARIVWRDEMRDAPPLEFTGLNFHLRNLGRHHSFGLNARPSAAIAAQIDLRANLSGKSFNELSQWAGQTYLEVSALDLAALAPWLTLPYEMSQGKGGLRLWLDFDDSRPTAVTADLALTDLSLRLGPSLPALFATQLAGRIAARRTAEGAAFDLKRVQLKTAEGIEFAPTDASLRLKTAAGRESGELLANRVELEKLTALLAYLPAPDGLRERLAAHAPRGSLANLDLAWQGPIDAPQGFRIRGDFTALALAPHRALPGFSGISGHIEGDDASGRVTMTGSDARLVLPDVFPEPTLMLGRLDAEIGWRTKGGGREFLIQRLNFANEDARGEALGSYRYTGAGPGEIDLTAKLVDAAGGAVWRYLPRAVSKDARDWLKASIRGGRAENTTLRLKGPLEQFPFRGGKGGVFQVRGVMRGVGLDYAPGWPAIDGIDGELLFENERMVIHARRASILGLALQEVRAEIPDLEAPEEMLTVTGRASGATQRFLDFIEASPVGAHIDHFTAGMSAAGNGALALKLVMPLRRLADTRVEGRYRFAGNRLDALPGWPPFSDVQGELAFTAERLQAKNLRARFLDQPLMLDIDTRADGALRINASGALSAHALRRQYDWPLFDHLSGETPWRGELMVKRPKAELRIETDLRGLASSLPEPFNKPARESLPLRVQARFDAERAQLNAALGQLAMLVWQNAPEGWRGRLAIGEKALTQSPTLPAQGLALAVNLPAIDLDAWRTLAADGAPGAKAPPIVSSIELQSPELKLLHRRFSDARLKAAFHDGRWRAALASREVAGDLVWETAGAGRISGRLARLHLPDADDAPPQGAETTEDSSREMPALDLVIDSFRVGEKSLGALKLFAENPAGSWQGKFDLTNDAARLSGEGRWRPGRERGQTALSFRLEVGNAEKLLARLRLPDALRRGEGAITGEVRWTGSPLAFDLPSLAGNLKIDVGKGQFKKLEPGVGRLLGVLSLQALPRRITLDFRDIFSEGFAFDSISGEAVIAQGVVMSDELRIQGPAAKVLLSGRVDLQAETQRLKVRVEPAIGESLAVGAMLAHPVAGAVAWAAQKVLKNPLDQIFAYEYAVTGPWSDPQVEKLGGAASNAPAAAPGSANE